MEVGGVGKSYQYTQRIKTLQTALCSLTRRIKKRKKYQHKNDICMGVVAGSKLACQVRCVVSTYLTFF